MQNCVAIDLARARSLVHRAVTLAADDLPENCDSPTLHKAAAAAACVQRRKPPLPFARFGHPLAAAAL